MTQQWAKMASNLDSHPKIRRAGRNGREVFLFALRKNAEPNNPVPGRLPGAWLEPWYVADQLMCDESDACDGLRRCVTAGLLAQDGDSWIVCGWADDWGKRPSSGAERTERWRERQKAKSTTATTCETGDVTVTEPSSHVTTSDACDALDKIRIEEKKKSTSGLPDVAALAEAAVNEINRLAKTAYRADSKETLQHCKTLSKLGITSEQIRTTICARKGWLSDDKMAQFFRPSTLLRPSNMRRYLEDFEARKPKRTEQTPDIPPEIQGFGLDGKGPK